jgi:hypothetical protein
MACWHHRYNLGDIQPKESPEEWLKGNAPNGSLVLSLYLYDHSGITMRTSPFDCPWDSGQVGYIVATPENIRKYTNRKLITKKLRANVEKWLKQEVSIYDDYLNHNVWGYVIEGKNGDGEIADDSCFGFYGDDLEGMKAYVDTKYHEALEIAWNNR